MAGLINVSVDVEEDISLYLQDSRVGLDEGLPRLLDLFQDLNIHADLFIQGNLVPSIGDLIKTAAKHGHRIGLHGVRHRGTLLHPTVEARGLRNAIASMTEITGIRPTTHRAPGFRLKERLLPVLEQTGLLLDSSILPNARFVRVHGRILLRSYEGAPRRPYHPSRRDVAAPGDSGVLEVPLTENPEFPRAPLGLGYLSTFGLAATQGAFAKVKEPYATFLIHTWEAVDLGARHPGLPDYVRRECSGNLEPLTELLKGLDGEGRFVLLEEIGSSVPTEVDVP